jgi:hypothetical protein
VRKADAEVVVAFGDPQPEIDQCLKMLFGFRPLAFAAVERNQIDTRTLPLKVDSDCGFVFLDCAARFTTRLRCERPIGMSRRVVAERPNVRHR